jgi:aspartate aminotransferase
MKIKTPNVAYSSIVQIGENIAKIEKETNKKYLKLHRGVMDVCQLDIESASIDLNLNSAFTQQYGGNDGDPELINQIKLVYKMPNSHVMITPGGMAALDLVISCLEEENFWIPEYHWGSWNKILTTHGKEMRTFNDFDLSSFSPKEGVVMLCYPSNPTGYCPEISEIEDFVIKCEERGITIILDLPYYYLFNDAESISCLFRDNVIIVSSFSKSIGLSGYRIGYVSTKNNVLYQAMRIRSLYKYNSISTIPQRIICGLLKQQTAIEEYKEKTAENIKNNIMVLEMNDLLMDYPSTPKGPFAVVKMSYDELLDAGISSVPLSKFTLNKKLSDDNLSRISVAVDCKLFWEYFEKVVAKQNEVV